MLDTTSFPESLFSSPLGWIAKMAPPRVQPSPRKDEDAAADDGDFFRFPPLTLSIIIVILLIFYWVSVKDV